MQLRPYQQEGIDLIQQAFRHHQRVVYCCPTGSGKTVTFAEIGRRAVSKGTPFMILVERKELLQQAYDKVAAKGITPTVIAPGFPQYQNHSYIASAQTLVRREFPAHVKLLIIDECHREIFDKVIAEHPHLRVIGFTATPVRNTRNQLSKHYTKIVENITISELIAAGHLADAVTYGVPIDLSGVGSRGGDYAQDEMFARFDRPQRYAGVVKNYLDKTPGRPALCFNVNIEHSLRMADEFRQAGVNAVHLDGGTPDGLRRKIIADYKAGRIEVVCNCDVLTFGFDAPNTEVVIANRATQSLALWLQICGRGSRPHPGKDRFTILDFGTNADRLGVWQAEREWTLKPAREKKALGAAPVKLCPACEAMLAVSARLCNACGYAYPLPDESEPPPEVDLVEVAPRRPALPPELRKPFREMGVAELEAVRNLRGYKVGWVLNMLREQDRYNREHLLAYADLRGYKPGWVDQQLMHSIKS